MGFLLSSLLDGKEKNPAWHICLGFIPYKESDVANDPYFVNCFYLKKYPVLGSFSKHFS
jgi:hypothetical protein